MNVDPRQNDPQYQSPLEGDSQRASQFGMGSQADAPLQQQGSAGTVPGTGGLVSADRITPGADVYGSDGKRLGTVQEVYDDSFLVQKGIFFVHDYFIPLNMVSQVTTDRIDLGLSADDAKSQDWSSRPGLSAVGRGVQANPATDTQQSDLDTQNNVNPSGLGTNAMGDRDTGAVPTPGASVVLPNQSWAGTQGMPVGTAMNPSGPTPDQYDASQYDRTMSPEAGYEQGFQQGNLQQADQLEPAQPRSDPGSLAGNPRSAGDLSGNPRSAGDLGGDTYVAGDMGGDSRAAGDLSGDPRSAGDLSGDTRTAMPGTNAPNQGSRTEQTFTAGDNPAYGTMPSANTPMQQQMPTSSSVGRTGSDDALQNAGERGMQGGTGTNAGNLDGTPQTPRSPDELDQDQEGMTNP